MRPAGWMTLMLATACGSSSPPPETDEAADSGRVDSLAVDPDLPPLDAAPGEIALRTGSVKPEYRVETVAAIEAVRCPDLGSLQFFAYEEHFAFGAMVSLPDGQPGADTLTVTRETEGLPQPGTARLALQIYPEERSYSMPGVVGVVVADTAGGVLSGNLDIRLFETVFLDSVALTAVFHRLPIVEGTPETCRVVGDAPDSSQSTP